MIKVTDSDKAEDAILASLLQHPAHDGILKLVLRDLDNTRQICHTGGTNALLMALSSKGFVLGIANGFGARTRYHLTSAGRQQAMRAREQFSEQQLARIAAVVQRHSD